MGPKQPCSPVLTPEQEASTVAFHRHTLLPLDNCLYALQHSIPALGRSSLQPHSISRLPETKGDKSDKKWFKVYPPGMHRTLKDATVKRYHHETHDQLGAHFYLFMDAYNHAHRLKALRGLTPYELICRTWTQEPDRFRIDPIHHTPELNTYLPRV